MRARVRPSATFSGGRWVRAGRDCVEAGHLGVGVWEGGGGGGGQDTPSTNSVYH